MLMSIFSTSLSPPQIISTEELVEALKPHILSSEQMWDLGYPLEIEPNSSKAVVFINPPPRSRQLTSFNVNAPEFVPSCAQSDSGHESLDSNPSSESEKEADFVTHMCVRCDEPFSVTSEGEYSAKQACFYHWGRIGSNFVYSCCGTPRGYKGCSRSPFHVWSGIKVGINGPLEGYVRAKYTRGGIYALDTEMCYTTAGLELASLVVISVDGQLVYESFVKTSSPVVDYNTRFSGIRSYDLANATKTLQDVQIDLLEFVGTDTILIGHALENDLRALKLIHSNVVDTSVLYPHPRGFPLRRSLRKLCEEYLGRSVQCSGMGHSPLEDAHAAMDLVLLKINEERLKDTRTFNQIPFYRSYIYA